MKLNNLKKITSVETVMAFGSSLTKKNPRDVDICIFTTKRIGLKEKLNILSLFPLHYDVNFFDDLPLNLKKRVLSEGKILFTKNYYRVLELMKIVDYEYPRFRSFVDDYHIKKMEALNG